VGGGEGGGKKRESSVCLSRSKKKNLGIKLRRKKKKNSKDRTDPKYKKQKVVPARGKKWNYLKVRGTIGKWIFKRDRRKQGEIIQKEKGRGEEGRIEN